jgi:putative PIN family toxin of toxin-antitoxin system
MIWVLFCILPQGYRRQLTEYAHRQRVRRSVSEYILDELEETLIDDLRQTRRFAKLARRAIERRAKVVSLSDVIQQYVPGDPDDDPIVQTAIAARADFLVTADSEVLKLRKIRGVRVVTPQAFAEYLGFVPD